MKNSNCFILFIKLNSILSLIPSLHTNSRSSIFYNPITLNKIENSFVRCFNSRLSGDWLDNDGSPKHFSKPDLFQKGYDYSW